MSDLKEISVADHLERIRIEHAIEDEDGDILENASLELDEKIHLCATLKDRIEQLEAALRKIINERDGWMVDDVYCAGCADSVKEARQALGYTQ